MNYEVAPFPLNNPPTPTTLVVACNGAGALHVFYHRASVRQILKFHERVISALKFELSGERSQILEPILASEWDFKIYKNN